MVTVGLLYPGHSAEDDYPALEARLDGAVRLPVVITTVGEDAHRVDALLDLGRAERLAEGAARLAAATPDAVMWACTSGSFVFGPDGARDQAAGVAAAAGVPASSTSIAFVDAVQHLGVVRVAVAASYPEEVARHFVDFLTAGGIDTHVHLISPSQIMEALAAGMTTLSGGGTGPSEGTRATERPALGVSTRSGPSTKRSRPR